MHRLTGAHHRSQKVDHLETVQERAEGWWSWITASGVEVTGVHRLLFLWKRLGAFGTFAVLAVVGFPAGEYSLISAAVNHTVPKLAGDFGVAVDADWSYHPFSLKAVARNAKIRPEHPASAPPIFTASEIEFQGSVASTLSTVWDALHLRPLRTFNEITIRNGVLRLERSIDGTLSVSDLLDRVDEQRRRDLASGAYHAEAINLEDVKIEYVEHMPGRSGGGIIQTTEAKVYIDGISGSITDVRRVDLSELERNRATPMPTRVKLSGRSSDGTIDVLGTIALVDATAGARADVGADPRLRRVSSGSESRVETRSGPFYALAMRLDNIGAAAFTRAVPNLEVIATHGIVRGTIALRDDAPACASHAAMVDVRFGPNPTVVIVPERFDRLQRLYATWVYSGEYDPCESVVGRQRGRTADEPRSAAAGSAAGMVLGFNRQATANAPPQVRAAVARDAQRIAGVTIADAVLDDTTDRVVRGVGAAASRIVGPKAAGAMQDSLRGTRTSSTARPGANDNPIAKGAKGIGHGLKKLFSRGDRQPR